MFDSRRERRAEAGTVLKAPELGYAILVDEVEDIRA
jgi:hypothetical protein